MEPKYKLGDIVYEYSHWMRAEYVIPKIIDGVKYDAFNVSYTLKGGSSDFINEKFLYSNKNELINRLIEEEMIRSKHYIDDLKDLMDDYENEENI